MPDKSKSGKRKTKVKKHTINPVFDEVLKVRYSRFFVTLSNICIVRSTTPLFFPYKIQAIVLFDKVK